MNLILDVADMRPIRRRRFVGGGGNGRLDESINPRKHHWVQELQIDPCLDLVVYAAQEFRPIEGRRNRNRWDGRIGRDKIVDLQVLQLRRNISARSFIWNCKLVDRIPLELRGYNPGQITARKTKTSLPL